LKSKIVIVGYRASGKSTLGDILAQRLGWPLLDIDRGIEVHIGTTLADYYRKVGEAVFRPLETKVVIEMCSNQTCVIAFGAGTLQTLANREHACRDALVVYLKASPEELWRRMSADPKTAATRPDLAGGGLAEVIEKLDEREPVYQQCADLIVDATEPSQTLAARVLAAFQG
jgi:shikimate kinase